VSIFTEPLKRLEPLYELTGRDWHLSVSKSLTEPFCAHAVVQPDGGNSLRYSKHADTIEEAILGALDLAYRGEILGEKVWGNSPVTNPDDRLSIP